MGGDDSQKLLPWRGSLLPSGAQTSGSLQNHHSSSKVVRQTAPGILSYHDLELGANL
jgi:hypothetical protein